MSGRHLQILNLLLDTGEIPLADISGKTRQFYSVKNPGKALVRDLSYLIQLGSLNVKKLPEEKGFLFSINLDWPTQITETEFFKRVKDMPKGKVYGFLSG
jgi:hypothetical protein